MMAGSRRRTGLLAWAVLLALTGVLFARTLDGLYMRWTDWDEGTYTHGLVVPLFSLFFLYDRREQLREIRMTGSMWGAAALIGSVALFFTGRLGNMLFVQAVAFIAALASLALLAGGWKFLKVTALPIGFLIFMCPLPSGIYDQVSAQLRLFASSVSTTSLQLAGVSAYREGNIILIPGRTLSVEDACSGIRSLFGILATATAFAAVVPGGWVRRSFLVVSAVPIAVFANIMRVTGTGLLHYYGSGRLAEGFYHYLEGWVFYVLALVFLFAEYYVLKAIFPLSGGTGGRAPDVGGGADGGEGKQ